LGVWQPKSHELAGAKRVDIASTTWPLHTKVVPRISLDAAERLSGGERSLADLRYVRGWLEDVSRYAPVATRSAWGIPTTSMPPAWVDKLAEHGVVHAIERRDVRGWVHMFAVPEVAKERWRPIKYTRDINETLGKETVMRLTFPSKLDIRELVHHGECFIALDFASYYDHFVYAPEVGARCCFRQGGRYFRLNTLAMGQRHAVEVAACTTARLLDFGPRSKTAAIIDNVVFVGSRADVLRDAAIFVERVNKVGGRLNEDTSDLAALVQTSGVWGGVQLDFACKTSQLAQKSVEKTRQSWMFRSQWTWRTFAAHIGLLFWAWQLIDVPMADFYPLLRFISHAGALLSANEDQWDAPAAVWPSVWPALARWTRLVFNNHPCVVRKASGPEWLVATDASEYGWGYFAVDNATGAVRTHGAAWSPSFRRQFGDRLGASTFSEPQGVVNAMCHLLDPAKPRRVRVLTDNTATQAIFARGFSSRSFHMNECVRRLSRLFGNDFVFDFAYLPGVVNPADAFSRGIARSEEGRDSVSAAELRRVAGCVVPPGKSDWLPVGPLSPKRE
jgi:hypothetical protein